MGPGRTGARLLRLGRDEAAAVQVDWSAILEPGSYWANDEFQAGTDPAGTWCYSVFLADALGRTSEPVTESFEFTG
jgi:hypothetical protein